MINRSPPSSELADSGGDRCMSCFSRVSTRSCNARIRVTARDLTFCSSLRSTSASSVDIPALNRSRVERTTRSAVPIVVPLAFSHGGCLHSTAGHTECGSANATACDSSLPPKHAHVHTAMPSKNARDTVSAHLPGPPWVRLPRHLSPPLCTKVWCRKAERMFTLARTLGWEVIRYSQGTSRFTGLHYGTQGTCASDGRGLQWGGPLCVDAGGQAARSVCRRRRGGK